MAADAATELVLADYSLRMPSSGRRATSGNLKISLIPAQPSVSTSTGPTRSAVCKLDSTKVEVTHD